MLDIHSIPLNDNNVWDMLSEGKTKGVFQLESYLGKTWCQKVRPHSIEELSDLIAIIRPGVLQFMYDEKSMAQHYADRKSGDDYAEPIHSALKDILKDTYQVLLYQEQIIRIAQEIAGFTESEADTLRKSVGKKDAKLLNSLEEQFVDGCMAKGLVNSDSATLIFSNIRKSARYLFNKCLDPSSIVQTPDGYKLLSEIQIGDYVLAPLNTNEDHYVEVIDTIDNGDKEVYEIELDDGNSITCTLDHKFLCSDGKKHKLLEIIQQDLSIMVYKQ